MNARDKKRSCEEGEELKVEKIRAAALRFHFSSNSSAPLRSAPLLLLSSSFAHSLYNISHGAIPFPLVRLCRTGIPQSLGLSRHLLRSAAKRARESERAKERRRRNSLFQFHRRIPSTPFLLSSSLVLNSLQSKKRGFSLEEKRQAVLGIFHDSADVFVLKV